MKDVYLVSMVRVTIPENASERLEQVLAFMSQHCSDATLASVAAHFNFHPNTVSGLIKRETGKSFGETLRAIRMERALTLLDAREIPVAQVAHLCGYENPSNFYRVFKETFGMTPRVYMAQREKEAAAYAAEGPNGEADAIAAPDAVIGGVPGGSLPSAEGVPGEISLGSGSAASSPASSDADEPPADVPLPTRMSAPIITGLDGRPLPRVRVSALAGKSRISGEVAPASAVATRQGEAALAALRESGDGGSRLTGLPDDYDLAGEPDGAVSDC